MDLDGVVLKTLMAPAGAALPPSASAFWAPDGETIAAYAWAGDGVTESSGGSGGTIVLDDVATDAGRVLDLGMPAWALTWSRHGDLVAFGPGDDSEVGVWVATADGKEALRLDSDARPAWLGEAVSAFTADDAWVVVTEVPPGATSGGATDQDIVRLRVDRQERLPVVSGNESDGSPTVSPDGSLVACIRVRGAADAGGASRGPSDLFVVPLAGGEPMLVSGPEGVYPGPATWSPEGDLLATWTPDWSDVVVFAADGSGERARVPSPDNFGYMSWGPLP